MRTLRRKTAQGFTLIELMIVVAIIGILAAIAIPNFLRFQLKAKSAEGRVNLAAIRTAEESYMSEFGNYVAAVAAPASVPGPVKAPLDVTIYTDWGILGWAPEGGVYFQYSVVTGGGGNLSYLATAVADLDGDATNQVVNYENAAGGSLGGCGNPGQVVTCTTQSVF